MKLSVVVPVYKVEEYLPKCIESILSQSFSDFELILVDDGSPDKCPEICEDYAKRDNRIHVVHQNNQGLSAARNTGIENAQGDFLAFIDSDDYICKDMFEILFENAARYDADISVCDAVLVNEDDACQFTEQTIVERYNGNEALEAMIYDRKFSVNAWNKIYRRELFNGIRYPEGLLYEDLATTYRLIDRCKRLVYSDAKLYAYVQRNGSIMNQTGYKMHPDKVRISIDMMDYFKTKYKNYDDFMKIVAGVVSYLVNDIYKMASVGNLVGCSDYRQELTRYYRKYKRIINKCKYISIKSRMVLYTAVNQPKFLEWMYYSLRRGIKGKCL